MSLTNATLNLLNDTGRYICLEDKPPLELLCGVASIPSTRHITNQPSNCCRWLDPNVVHSRLVDPEGNGC
jgi:hypothetical protein